MSDLVVTVNVTVNANDETKALFSYAPGGTPAPGWSVDSHGTITPPLTGPGSGTFEFQLQTSGSSFAGFNVAQSPITLSTENWASLGKLEEHHLAPSQPAIWPPSGTISEPLALTLGYGSAEASPGHYCSYRLKVEIGNQIYSDDPKIYTDPVT